MKKLLLACTLLLSFSAFVGCGKDDDDEPGNVNGGGSSSSNVSTGTVKMGDDSFKVKYAYVINGSFDGISWSEYYFYDKDIMKYVENKVDMEDIDEEFSSLYFEYWASENFVDDLYIEYKYNGYNDTGYYFEFDDDKGEVSDYVSVSSSKKNVKASAKSVPMIRVNERTGSEKEVSVSFSLDANPLDVSQYVDYDDYNYTRSAIEVKEVSDPKQVAFLRSLKNRHKNIAK